MAQSFGITCKNIYQIKLKLFRTVLLECYAMLLVLTITRKVQGNGNLILILNHWSIDEIGLMLISHIK